MLPWFLLQQLSPWPCRRRCCLNWLLQERRSVLRRFRLLTDHPIMYGGGFELHLLPAWCLLSNLCCWGLRVRSSYAHIIWGVAIRDRNGNESHTALKVDEVVLEFLTAMGSSVLWQTYPGMEIKVSFKSSVITAMAPKFRATAWIAIVPSLARCIIVFLNNTTFLIIVARQQNIEARIIIK